ncbi:Uncharacterised protein [Niallia circulans]|jgi:hypothetical protein|uniref:hypothetical protein n=1 Tax=Niallia circulans TaxID=1397 RepID=UPI00077C1BBF|nr:hypothetical protein [Niallia circulans]MDR4315024.1 hypothetical protein [Niallia circulans]MED3839752.1 hypothetical protein [Niallia circulans]MED4241238.1 hypothetical protein [Niallia circulans]MED4247899.1 hypothetical protein [Niallia circulans]QKH61620.1 hypothetical protein FOC77_13670 [Niallia circulans]
MDIIIALEKMIVNDIEDETLGPLIINPGDEGVITGTGDYPNGKAFEVNINGDQIFLYGISPKLWKFKEGEC